MGGVIPLSTCWNLLLLKAGTPQACDLVLLPGGHPPRGCKQLLTAAACGGGSFNQSFTKALQYILGSGTLYDSIRIELDTPDLFKAQKTSHIIILKISERYNVA